MSSKPIYPHVPYFYIIEHIATGKRYAGCRYAKGCNPEEFMKPDGYRTSSATVNKIIEEEGLVSFKIVEIKTQDEVGNVHVYETQFLVENGCAKSTIWLNKQNNSLASFGSEEFKSLMTDEYGYDRASKVPKFKEKIRESCLSRLGVDNPSKSEHVKDKKRETCLKNHGVEYSLQSDEIKEKFAKTCLQLYGSENPFASKIIIEKIKSDCLEKHGVEHHQSRPEVRSKISKSLTGREFSEEHKTNISASKKGKVLCKNTITGEVFSVEKTEFDKNPNLIGLTAGLIPCKDQFGNFYQVTKDDPRYISKELVHVSKGTSNTKAKGTRPAVMSDTGKSIGRVSCSDPRFITGEIKAPPSQPNKFSGGKWMNLNGEKITLVAPNDLPDYLSNGYTFGRIKNGKGG